MIVALLIFLYIENNVVVFIRYTVNSNKLPNSFDGFNIIHLSDVHGKVFRNENDKIINLIENAKPNIIVVTGDLIDRRRYNEENALKIIDGLKDIAPIYYVTGNHEAWSGEFSSLESKLK